MCLSRHTIHLRWMFNRTCADGHACAAYTPSTGTCSAAVAEGCARTRQQQQAAAAAARESREGGREGNEKGKIKRERLRKDEMWDRRNRRDAQGGRWRCGTRAQRRHGHGRPSARRTPHAAYREHVQRKMLWTSRTEFKAFLPASDVGRVAGKTNGSRMNQYLHMAGAAGARGGECVAMVVVSNGSPKGLQSP